MSYQVYLFLHIASVILLFISLSGLLFTRWHHGEAAGKPPWWRLLVIGHGLALFLLLFSGFGLMARLEISHGAMWPTWLLIKFGLWLFLGAYLVLVKRMYRALVPLLALLYVVGIVIVWTVVYKPGEVAYRQAQAAAAQVQQAVEEGAEDAAELAGEAAEAARDIEPPSPADVVDAVEAVEREVADIVAPGAEPAGEEGASPAGDEAAREDDGN